MGSSVPLLIYSQYYKKYFKPFSEKYKPETLSSETKSVYTIDIYEISSTFK